MRISGTDGIGGSEVSGIGGMGTDGYSNPMGRNILLSSNSKAFIFQKIFKAYSEHPSVTHSKRSSAPAPPAAQSAGAALVRDCTARCRLNRCPCMHNVPGLFRSLSDCSAHELFRNGSKHLLNIEASARLKE